MISRLEKNFLPGKSGYRGIIILLSAFIFYNLLFINKAFHIDDPSTINVAREININFIKAPRSFFSNPILLQHYYAPIIKFLGEKEALLHIFYLPFSVLAVVSMFILSQKFIGKGLLATLSLVISPAFLISSHSIMLDIPMLSFFLASLAAFIYGIDKNDKKLLFLSGVLAGTAILIKYTGLFLIPLMFLYALRSSKKNSFLFLLIPASMFLIWGIYNLALYKNFPFIHALLTRINMWSFKVILTRFLAALSFISGASIINLFLMPFLAYKKNNRLLFFLSLPAALLPYLFSSVFNEYSYLEKFLLAVFFVPSVFIIFLIFKNGLLSFFKRPRDKDRLFLSVWFFILLFFNIFAQFISARFILLLYPPMFLFIFKELTFNYPDFFAKFKKIILAAVLLTFLLSTVLAVGDYRFAGAYRDFVVRLSDELGPGAKIYFCPGFRSSYYSWGYAYYLERFFPKISRSQLRKSLDNKKNVFFPLPSEPVLPIVITDACSFKIFHNFAVDKVLVKEFDYTGNVFLHNQKYRVGFYSHNWGLLPFRIFLRKYPLEKFYVYKLMADKNDSSVVEEGGR